MSDPTAGGASTGTAAGAGTGTGCAGSGGGAVGRGGGASIRGTDIVAGIAGAPPGMGSGGSGNTVGGGMLGAPVRGPLGSGGGMVLPGALAGSGGGMIIMVGAEAGREKHGDRSGRHGASSATPARRRKSYGARMWILKGWDELTVDQLYACLRLRAEVFVVEQRCAYADLDDRDQRALHLWCADEAGALLAYARIFAATGDADAVIGRVITAPAARGTGLGRQLMVRAIAACGPHPIAISAQAHLQGFYGSLGFVTTSPPYLEDDIPHVAMRRAVA